MFVYSAGADAFRDTTKWLVAFVPIAALGTAAVVLGPLLVRSPTGSALAFGVGG